MSPKSTDALMATLRLCMYELIYSTPRCGRYDDTHGNYALQCTWFVYLCIG